MTVESKFIVKLQGKDFILYDGLLDMAHQMGLTSIKTQLVSFENGVVIFKATAKAILKSEAGNNVREVEFDGYGDADSKNVNSMIAKHMIRMAETRAKARALRDLTNVGMCSVEELGGDDTLPPTTTKTGNETGKSQSDDALDVFDTPITDDDVPKTQYISDKQQGRLFAKAGYVKGDEEAIELSKDIVKTLLDEYELQSTKEIKKGKEYDEICEKAEVLLAERLS